MRDMADGSQRHSSCFAGSLTFVSWRSWTGPAYGYEMTRRLRERGLRIVAEGSIYPLLGRLERDGLVDTYRAASNDGPAAEVPPPLEQRAVGARDRGF